MRGSHVPWSRCALQCVAGAPVTACLCSWWLPACWAGLCDLPASLHQWLGHRCYSHFRDGENAVDRLSTCIQTVSLSYVGHTWKQGLNPAPCDSGALAVNHPLRCVDLKKLHCSSIGQAMRTLRWNNGSQCLPSSLCLTRGHNVCCHVRCAALPVCQTRLHTPTHPSDGTVVSQAGRIQEEPVWAQGEEREDGLCLEVRLCRANSRPRAVTARGGVNSPCPRCARMAC